MDSLKQRIDILGDKLKTLRDDPEALDAAIAEAKASLSDVTGDTREEVAKHLGGFIDTASDVTAEQRDRLAAAIQRLRD